MQRNVQEIENLGSVVHTDAQRTEWRKLSSVVHRNFQEIKNLRSVVHRDVQRIEWRKLRVCSAQKYSGN